MRFLLYNTLHCDRIKYCSSNDHARSLFVLVGLLICFAPAVMTQPLAPDRPAVDRSLASLYQKPQDVLDGARIAGLEAQLNTARPDFISIQAGARAELDRFNAQFIADKRIADQRRFARYEPGRSDANSLRLLSVLRTRKVGEGYFLGDAPYLRRLYTILGQAYAGQNDKSRALWAYHMALRYSSRDVVQVSAADVLPVSGDDVDLSPEQRAAHDEYLLMYASFADPDRIAQSQNAGMADAARRFRQLLPDYQQNRRMARELQKQVYVAEAARARGQNPNPTVAALQTRLQTAEQNRDRAFNELEGIRNGAYRRFLSTKKERGGELAYQMALLVRGLESENYAQMRKIYGQSYLRGIGLAPTPDRTQQRSFAGYVAFLELAHFFDSDNLNYLNLLGIEYRLRRRPLQAIAFTEKYIERARATQPAPPELPVAYLRLARLETDQRNYLAAALAREAHLELIAPEQRTLPVVLALADLHFKHTGRFERAAELYTEYLNNFNNLDLAALPPEERTQWRSSAFVVQHKRSMILKRQRQDAAELEALMAARQIYSEIKNERQALEQTELGLQTRLLELKKELLSRERPALQEQYYALLRRDLPAARQARLALERKMQALDYGGVLDRMARIAFKERRFADSQSLFLELVQEGRSLRATAARRNLTMIEKILADGILRPLPN